MEYKELSKLYHMSASSSRDADAAQELEARLGADSTFRLDFRTPQGQLFIAVPRELSVLSERVLRTERKISNLVHSLPAIAYDAVLRGFVLDEVVCNNAIEDIHSTRRQIKDALDAPAPGRGGAKRFREFALLYLGLIDGTQPQVGSPQDVRAIYDQVTRGEIAPDKLPDGRLFRAQGVDIVQGGGRVVHSGLEPEEKIIGAIKDMLAVSRRQDMPALYRALAAHYLFEYIHPFYDGNGRTGRYLLSLMLSESLSAPTALSLSRTIAEHRDAYYKAFQTTQNPLNHGELTFFVHAMTELIRDAQLRLEERLERNIQTLADMDSRMADIAAAEGLGAQEAQIVFMLMQYQAFGLFGDAALHQIAGHMGIKEQMTRRHLKSLEGKGVVLKWNERSPISFALTPAFKQRYGVEPPDWRMPVA